MRTLLFVFLLLGQFAHAAGPSFGYGQSRAILPGGNLNPPSGAGTIVDVLGRLEGGNSGDAISLQIITNSFVGAKVGSWSLVGSGQPVVQTTQPITIAGLQLADGTGLGDAGTKMWRFQADGTDAYPSYSLTAGGEPSIVVFGFSLMCSNWTGSENKGLDWFRVDQSPFLIVQFQAGSEVSGHITIGIHTDDGVGPTVEIVNNTWYWITGIYRRTGTVELKVYTYTAPGTYTFLGGSSLTMPDGTADHVRFTQNDDHGLTPGSRYIYVTTYALVFGNASAYPLLPNQ